MWLGGGTSSAYLVRGERGKVFGRRFKNAQHPRRSFTVLHASSVRTDAHDASPIVRTVCRVDYDSSAGSARVRAAFYSRPRLHLDAGLLGVESRGGWLFL